MVSAARHPSSTRLPVGCTDSFGSQVIVCLGKRVGVREFLLGQLHYESSANPNCKPMPREISNQNILHRLFYPENSMEQINSKPSSNNPSLKMQIYFKTQIKSILNILSILFFALTTTASFAHSYEDIIGKTFINSSGSSEGGFLMSVSVKVMGRNTVAIGFITGSIYWSETDISVLGENSTPPALTHVMLNCKSKTFSTWPEPEKENAYTMREYDAGSKYKWGNYSAQDLMYNVSDDHKKSLTKFFQTVCEYTAQ